MATKFTIEEFRVADKNYVIEASAGTGKTYNIVEMIKVLRERSVPLEQILVVTYTEKAAGELKERIRKERPMDDIDNASIGTIHSFCLNATGEFCIASGKPSELKQIDEAHAERFIRAYLREGANLPEVLRYQSSLEKGNAEENIIKETLALFGKYYLDSDYREVPSIVSIPEKNSEVEDFVLSHIDDMYRRWQEEKAKYAEQTFSDMLRNVRENVVKGGPLLERLRNKYRYAIIDEFQDTNQIQWDIFRTVFLEENHRLIVVGDPKQSIYAFQGADISVYRKATDEIEAGGGLKRILDTNYRATEDIVNSANAFFEHERAIVDGKAIPVFEHSICGKKLLKVTYDGKPVKAYWIVEKLPPMGPSLNSLAPKKSKRNPYMEAQANAEVVCKTIVDCCSYVTPDKTKLRLTDDKGEERNVRFGDFTILGRTHKELEPFQKALEKSGIPYLKYKDTSLFNGKECADWIAVLEAVNVSDFTGNKRSFFRRAVNTAFFGVTLRDLTDPRFDKDSIDEIVLFERWRNRAKAGIWEELIEGILRETQLEEKLTSLKNLKSLGAYRQLGEYCIDYLYDGHDLSGLVHHLNRTSKSEGAEESPEEAGWVSRGTDFDSVKIMTIHASKGLEFPVVISAAGWKNPIPKQSINVFGYHDSDDNYCLSLNDDGPYFEELFREWQRLFYVAYTRAKYVLILPKYIPLADPMDFVAATINDYSQNHSYRPVNDDASLKPEDLKKKVRDILDKTRKAAEPAAAKAAQEEVLKEMIAGRSAHATAKYAYSSMSHSPTPSNTDPAEETEEFMDENGVRTEHEETASKGEDAGLAAYDASAKQIPCAYDGAAAAVTLSENYPAGAALGNALHDILEKADYVSPCDIDHELIRDCFKERGLRSDPALEAETSAMIKSVLLARLPEIHGSAETGNTFSLSEIPRTERKNEVEFNFNKEGEKLKNFFNGFVDLIVRRGEYFSILDWKSDRLREEFDSFCDGIILKKHVDETYSIQRVLYSYILIKWLKNYYPDLSEEKIFEKHFGGVYYVFLRGCSAGTGNGIYAQTWENYRELKKAFDKIVKEKVRW